MDNLDEKEKRIWHYKYYLEIAEIHFKLYEKRKEKMFYDWGMEMLEIADKYKLNEEERRFGND